MIANALHAANSFFRANIRYDGPQMNSTGGIEHHTYTDYTPGKTYGATFAVLPPASFGALADRYSFLISAFGGE